MKDIKDYEGLYAVTEDGQVWSYKRKIFLKPSKRRGYLGVHLYKNGAQENKYIHRLVLETYSPCENMKDLQVNHRDENKENNCLDNLEWLTQKDNLNYGTHNERISKKVRCIETKIIYKSINEAAEAIGKTRQALSMCLNGKTKTCGGFHWEFVD